MCEENQPKSKQPDVRYVVSDHANKFFQFPWQSKINMLGETKTFGGGVRLESPGALPALL